MSHPEEPIEQEEIISLQEKSTIVALVTSLVVFAIYALVVWQRYQAVDLAETEVFRFWGAAILILVPVQVVAQIIAQIVFGIVNMIATREEYTGFSDERDNLIELKSTRNFYHTFMVGFFLAMGSLVLDGVPTVTMFVIFFGAMIVAAVVSELSKLYYYRKGF